MWDRNNLLDTAVYNLERRKVDGFAHYHSFFDYTGNVILYPVAAYSTVYDNKWVECRSQIYEWLKSQPYPIKYEKVVSYFVHLASITLAKPPIFDIDFRALTQILAVIGPPTSAKLIQQILPHINDMTDNVYGVAIGSFNELEIALIKAELEKNNYVIANVSKKIYENKFLIWVTGSSDFIPTQNNLAHPDFLQQYWQSRHLQIQNNNMIEQKTKLIAPVKEKITKEVINTKLQEKQPFLLSSSFSSIFIPYQRNNCIINYERIKNVDINKDELENAIANIKKDKMNDLFFDASISLSVSLNYSPYEMTHPMFFAFICLNANPNLQDYLGDTSLHKLIERLQGNLPEDKRRHLIRLVGWLIESGADINLINKNGKSPFSFAKDANLIDELNMQSVKAGFKPK